MLQTAFRKNSRINYDKYTKKQGLFQGFLGKRAGRFFPRPRGFQAVSALQTGRKTAPFSPFSRPLEKLGKIQGKKGDYSGISFLFSGKKIATNEKLW